MVSFYHLVKKYGCRRKETIKVSAKYSAHERSKSTTNQNQTTAPSSKSSNVTFPSFVPPNVKQKISLWRRHDKSKEILKINKGTDQKIKAIRTECNNQLAVSLLV